MIHRQRVNGWAVIFATMAEMLMAGQAALIWFGVLLDDPNALALAELIAFTVGCIALMVFYPLWQGITLNVGNCPVSGQQARPVYQDYGALNADTMTIYADNTGMNWMLRYPTSQWRAVQKVLDGGRDNLPYREFSGTTVSRDDWERLREDLVRAGLAIRTKSGQVVINSDGKRIIRKAARTPLPQAERA